MLGQSGKQGDKMADSVKLSDWLRPTIEEKFGTLVAASKAIGVDYEKLRKQLERNSFNKSDLEKLVPESSPDELLRTFTFSYRQPKDASSNMAPAIGNGTERSFATFIDRYFFGMKYINPEVPLEEFVLKAYNALGNGDIQVLFFDPTYLPVEWGLHNSNIIRAIRDLLTHGASICYLSPYSRDEITINQMVEKNKKLAADLSASLTTPARGFKEFSKDIFQGGFHASTGSPSGLLVHLRVGSSPFASPYQKWSLFSLHDSHGEGSAPLPASNKVSLLTTKTIRDRNRGKAAAIEIVLPQARDIVDAQLEFLKRSLEDFINDVPEGNLRDIETPQPGSSTYSDKKRLARRIMADLDVGFELPESG